MTPFSFSPSSCQPVLRWLTVLLAAGWLAAPVSGLAQPLANPEAAAWADSAWQSARNCRSNAVQTFAAKAIELGLSTDCYHCIADATHALAVHEYHRGYMENARQYFEEALDLYEQLSLLSEASFCAAGAAQCDLQLGLDQHAILLIRRAREHASEAGDTLARASAMLCQGDYYFIRHEFTQATNHYEQVLPLLSNTGKTAGLYAQTLCKLASVRYQSRQHDTALQTSLEALRIARENNLPEVMADLHAQIACIFRDKGDDDKALTYINKAIATDSAANHQALLARRYLQKGELLGSIEQHEQAIVYFLSAVQIAKALHLNQLQTEGYALLARAYDATGNRDQHILYSEKAGKR